MTYSQTVTPNPHIPCKPGWCLQYVRQAYGLPARHPTATAAWEASTSKHRDRNFPAGVWTPVWYALANEPAGHVVLRAPDGSVFSTSDLSNKPHHHPDLADLERYYARYGMKLTYRGWTEDVAGYQVIASNTITTQSTNEDDMPTAKDVAAETVALLLAHPVDRQGPGMTGTVTLAAILAWYDANNAAIPSNVWSYRNPAGEESRDAYQVLRDIPTDPQQVADLVPDSIAQDVIDALSARLSQ